MLSKTKKTESRYNVLHIALDSSLTLSDFPAYHQRVQVKRSSKKITKQRTNHLNRLPEEIPIFKKHLKTRGEIVFISETPA